LFANARPRHKKDVAAIATANQNGSVSTDSVKSSCEEKRVDVKHDLLMLDEYTTYRMGTLWEYERILDVLLVGVVHVANCSAAFAAME